MDSVLTKQYIKPQRPYSQKELQVIRENNYKKLRLGNIMIRHKECGHFYLARQHGRKEKLAIENNTEDVGNCSVCWKINRTPKNLKATARSIVEDICKYIPNANNLSYGLVDLENDYYTWLYNEFNPAETES